LNILVKPAGKGVYEEKLATVLVVVPIQGWSPMQSHRVPENDGIICVSLSMVFSGCTEIRNLMEIHIVVWSVFNVWHHVQQGVILIGHGSHLHRYFSATSQNTTLTLNRAKDWIITVQ
jgi:hypothetical protein